MRRLATTASNRQPSTPLLLHLLLEMSMMIFDCDDVKDDLDGDDDDDHLSLCKNTLIHKYVRHSLDYLSMLRWQDYLKVQNSLAAKLI